jgi:hypothetical protein
MVESSELVFITSSGKRLHYEPISPVALEYAEQGITKKYRERGEPLDPPTYTVETAGGGSQTFDHDAESIKDDLEAEAAWASYLDAQQRLSTEIGTVRNRIILSAVQVELPEDKTWMYKQKSWGIEIPLLPKDTDYDDPEEFEYAVVEYGQELRLHYLQTELLKTVNDAYGIVDMIMRASLEGAISKEAIDAASASFRSTLPDAQRELVAPDQLESEGSALAA